MCIFGEKLDETALDRLTEFEFAVHCVCVTNLNTILWMLCIYVIMKQKF